MSHCLFQFRCVYIYLYLYNIYIYIHKIFNICVYTHTHISLIPLNRSLFFNLFHFLLASASIWFFFLLLCLSTFFSFLFSGFCQARLGDRYLFPIASARQTLLHLYPNQVVSNSRLSDRHAFLNTFLLILFFFCAFITDLLTGMVLLVLSSLFLFLSLSFSCLFLSLYFFCYVLIFTQIIFINSI